MNNRTLIICSIFGIGILIGLMANISAFNDTGDAIAKVHQSLCDHDYEMKNMEYLADWFRNSMVNDVEIHTRTNVFRAYYKCSKCGKEMSKQVDIDPNEINDW